MPRTPPALWGQLFNFAGGGRVHMELFPEGINLLKCQTKRDTNYTIPDATWEIVPWESANFNDSTMWDAGDDPTIINIKSPGIYLATAQISYTGGTGGHRGLNIAVNLTYQMAYNFMYDADSGYMTETVTGIHHLDLNDEIQLALYQNTGSPLDIVPLSDCAPYLTVWQLTQD